MTGRDQSDANWDIDENKKEIKVFQALWEQAEAHEKITAIFDSLLP